ncbi:MAG: SPOR domain-containing protein [Halanaerobiales bacterium]
MDRNNSLSITALVIVLALLGLFVGYLLGNWFIQMVTGENSETQQVQGPEQDNKIVEEEIVLEEEEEDENDNKDENENKESSSNYSTTAEDDNGSSDNNDLIENQLQGDVYVVQVGAFNNRQNAVSLKDELTAKGIQAVVTDEGPPYKVQTGASNNKEEAEELEEEIEKLGYEAFITH